MLQQGTRQIRSELKDFVAQASNALARMDSERLEELAHSCEALNRQLDQMGAEERAVLSREASEAAADMGVFARVLEATRANLSVMKRLRELRQVRLEYTDRHGLESTSGEDANGDH